MKRYILFCLLLLNSVFVFARSVVWYEGSVVLKSREVLTGEISIEPDYDLILHRSNGKVEVYPAHKINSLYFYDAEANINRKFISLKETGLFNHHQLFEIVLRGEVSIYRKQKLFTGTNPSDAEGYLYYIYHNEQLTDLIKFRTQIYPQLLESSGNTLSVFIKDHRLNPNSSANAIEIIKFYNDLQLKNEDHLLARY